MRLSTLEIKGFKSFGEKVTIHFDKGVTSIVGPNGSGKSNVVDAMRWVLGEQKTRMLRSEKMENIIFNGTKTRKPANIAEVSLTFENTKNILPTEYSTVTITRRLYRSGESEYLLNNVTCRLKDITDLFLDTGIGPDSYAIIELKMVDEILNDKHNAIKNLLEEAAGISKYKMRKKQTLQKLSDTDADLDRVNDLLFEIERNMKTLESQAKKTDRYYRLKDQYKEMSSELSLFTLSSSKVSFNELQEQEVRQQEEKIQLDTKLNETEAGLQQLKLTALDKEKQLSDEQKILNEKVAFIRQQENDKKVSNEKLKHLQEKEGRLTEQITRDKNTLLETLDQIRKNEEEKTTEEGILDQLQNQLAELKQVLDETRGRHDLMTSNISRLTAEAQSIQSAMYESEKSLAVFQTKKESLHNEIERLKIDNRTRQSEFEELNAKAEQSKTNKEIKETELNELHSTEENLAGEIIKSDEELKKITEQVISEGRKLDAKQNEYNLTKSLLENLEGYPESLRFLRKNSPTASHAPLFSEILNCPAEYKSAIENYLDPFMNYFVIDNIQEASRAVNLLSEASKGRANFFILANFNDTQTPFFENVKGCIPALEIIDVADKYRNLCSHLLRNVYIVTENQDHTPYLQDEKPGHIFISKNGKYCRTKHSLSGGSVGLFDGKRIGRAKHLENLGKEIESLTSSLEQIKARRDQLQQHYHDCKHRKEKLTGEKNRLQQETNRAIQEYSSFRNKAEHLQSSVENNSKIIEDLQKQLTAIDDDLQRNDISFHEHIDQLRNDHEVVTRELTNLQLDFTSLTEVMNHQSSQYNQQHIQFIQQQNKIATIIRDHAYKVQLTENLNIGISSNSADLENVQNQVRELLESSTGFDDQLLALYTEKEELDQRVSEVEKEYFKSRGDIDELESILRGIRTQREQSEQIAQSIKDKTNELKLTLNSLKERLAVEFSIDINELLEKEPNPELNESELREKVNKIKGQLDNYGPINPMAVEAFNEIQERHNFITAQKEDLAKAKASLLQTIEEIENTAKENFMKAFTDIRQNFIKVFRSLFTEDDDCDLVLLNPENPTESEVQIIAKPKGKRPLSISQLSGGEKTLTATALLFGIYLLKPAPFCIFDEVDAPLDDNNIDKFNNIIRKFSSESQFIIITHNKRTMTATDIIYGITMVEQGVTQVVPVDLAELADI
ncbi:MAG: chromosome segregation protein SMC [Bacteroidetes bacterium]|nr:MAG: chromosome segregation protein SMC [Bacteroidota bacterium]REK06055.1 MAG: chromosome segregation protein SMC [Bacteroidota bacterium]REK37113.1 MAG: chromosome segregation protein SMC [Bacteroidota bacterium]